MGLLKGQAIAQYYPEELRTLRQCGDIDVIVWKDNVSFKASKKLVTKFAQQINPKIKCGIHHICFDDWNGITLELHFVSSYFCNPIKNRIYRKWCVAQRKNFIESKLLGCKIPQSEYDIIFALSHMFRHYIGEGIGFRQLLDYYYVVLTYKMQGYNPETMKVIDSLGLSNFISGNMWVLQYVFGLNTEYLICNPNERYGKDILSHIIVGGNFGHYNNTQGKKTHAGRFFSHVIHNLKLLVYYPEEVIWSPVIMIRNFIKLNI